MKSSDQKPKILIVEDDPDQMVFLVDFALNEINKLIDDHNQRGDQRQTIESIQIIKVNNIGSLRKAASIYQNVLLAIMDCNIPDTKDDASHDQLVKTNHRITGQHTSVDIVTQYLPDTPITMISSLNRFQKIVSQYYENKHGLSINFISKNDQSMIQKNIGYYLRQYLRANG